jgi:hypothetical protein
MNRFAELLDRLAYEHGRNNKLRLMTDYFRSMPDPERGYALAALTGALSFKHAKPGMIRTLIAERSDPVLFALSYARQSAASRPARALARRARRNRALGADQASDRRVAHRRLGPACEDRRRRFGRQGPA